MGEHDVLVRVSQRGWRWKALQEALVVWDDGLDSRLLKHYLGHPNCVGVPRVTPRKVSGCAVVPYEQLLSDRTDQRYS